MESWVLPIIGSKKKKKEEEEGKIIDTVRSEKSVPTDSESLMSAKLLEIQIPLPTRGLIDGSEAVL